MSPAVSRAQSDGALVIAGTGKDIRIERAPPHAMFRWTVTVDGRKRVAISLVAVLRQVREALDPAMRRTACVSRSLRWCRRTKPHCRPIPVSVLTGFLGSGKTTMLRHLLGRPELSRTAVIINEFGEVGIDHELDRGERGRRDRAADRLPLLQDADRSGANAAGPVAAARRRPLRAVRSHRHRDGGLADPAPILQTLMTDAR